MEVLGSLRQDADVLRDEAGNNAREYISRISAVQSSVTKSHEPELSERATAIFTRDLTLTYSSFDTVNYDVKELINRFNKSDAFHALGLYRYFNSSNKIIGPNALLSEWSDTKERMGLRENCDSVHIHPLAEIREGLVLNGTGIRICSNVKIGDFCTIGNNIIIGEDNPCSCPKAVIGNGVKIESNARILSGYTIGDNTRIQRNILVNFNVPQDVCLYARRHIDSNMNKAIVAGCGVDLAKQELILFGTSLKDSFEKVFLSVIRKANFDDRIYLICFSCDEASIHISFQELAQKIQIDLLDETYCYIGLEESSGAIITQIDCTDVIQIIMEGSNHE